MGGCCRHDTCAKSARNGGGSHVPDTAGRRVAPRRCASRDRGPGAPRRRSGPGSVDSMTFHWSFASYSLVAVGLADGVASAWVLRHRGAIGRVSVAMLLATRRGVVRGLRAGDRRGGAGPPGAVGSVQVPRLDAASPAWMVFVLEYTGHGRKVTRP